MENKFDDDLELRAIALCTMAFEPIENVVTRVRIFRYLTERFIDEKFKKIENHYAEIDKKNAELKEGIAKTKANYKYLEMHLKGLMDCPVAELEAFLTQRQNSIKETPSESARDSQVSAQSE